MKKVRNRSTARYIERSFFRHNDRNIPEHYIDNVIKKPEVSHTMEYAVGTYMLALQRLTRQLDRIPGGIQDDEKKRLISAVNHKLAQIRATYEILAVHSIKANYDSENKPMPRELEILWTRVVEAEKYGERKQQRINKLMQENPSKGTDYVAKIITGDPLFKETMNLYEKYLRPMRIVRNKKRNKLLSEAHFGSEKNRHDDYRGLW
jgi:hypothetical protein